MHLRTYTVHIVVIKFFSHYKFCFRQKFKHLYICEIYSALCNRVGRAILYAMRKSMLALSAAMRRFILICIRISITLFIICNISSFRLVNYGFTNMWSVKKGNRIFFLCTFISYVVFSCDISVPTYTIMDMFRKHNFVRLHCYQIICLRRS